MPGQIPGPRPTPKKVLEKRGSWRAKTQRNAPEPKAGAPVCPKWLQPRAKAIWKQLVPQLKSLGILTKLDGFILQRYCEHFAEWRACKEFLHERGIKYPKRDTDGNLIGFGTFPEVMLERMHGKALLEIEREYGMTPASRSRLLVDKAEKPAHGNAADDKKRFFNAS